MVAKKKQKRRGPKPKAKPKLKGKVKEVKRGRGRPPGSKNKVKRVIKSSKSTGNGNGKKRGRPKKAYTESNVKRSPSWLPDDYKAPKAFKIIGYCSCKERPFICTKDLISKFVYVCPICEKRARTNKLKASGKKKEVLDPKAWKEDIIAEPNDMLPLNEKVEDIKVLE